MLRNDEERNSRALRTRVQRNKQTSPRLYSPPPWKKKKKKEKKKERKKERKKKRKKERKKERRKGGSKKEKRME